MNVSGCYCGFLGALLEAPLISGGIVKILVTAKRVTDPDARIRVRADGTGIETAGLEYKLNPFCENAIEEAVRLKEKHGGEIVAITIGDEEAQKSLRGALAMGADRGIHVKLTDFQLDSDLTARILAKIFEKEAGDLFILGKQAVDGDSNQVGQLVAQYAGLPQACFASKVTVDGTKVTVNRDVDGGMETLEITLPALITADLRLNEPRLPKLPDVLKSKKKPVEELTAADLGVDTALKVQTVGYSAPAGRAGGRRVGSVDELVELLKNEAKVL